MPLGEHVSVRDVALRAVAMTRWRAARSYPWVRGPADGQEGQASVALPMEASAELVGWSDGDGLGGVVEAVGPAAWSSGSGVTWGRVG